MGRSRQARKARFVGAARRADASTSAVGITFTCTVPPGTEPRINEEHSAARWVDPAYYRRRFFNDEAMAALRDNPVAHGVVTAVREVVDGYNSYVTS